MRLIRRRVKGGEITMAGLLATTTKGHRMPESATIKPFLDHLTEGRELPAGFSNWGFKVVRHDLTTFPRPDGRFQWPHPTADGPAIIEDPGASGTELCPSPESGGLSLAKTCRGARDGGYGYGTIILCAYNDGDVVASGQTKVRVRRAAVVAVLNPDDVYANVAGVDISRADLSGARLDGANFAGANCAKVKFHGANLANTHFEGADCTEASFNRANLTSADFSGADLTGAEAHMANLRSARLGLAKLNQAKFTGADMNAAQFDGADVTGANFSRVNLIGVAGQPKNAGRAASTVNAVLFSGERERRAGTHPFRPISVPRGRQDIYDALTRAGEPVAWEGAGSSF